MNTWNATEILNALGEPNAWKGHPEHWDEAMAAMPPGPLPFLDKATLPERCLAARIAPDRAAYLATVADEVAADPVLKTYAWYMHWRVFVAPEHGVPWGSPSLRPKMGARGGAVYLLLALDFPEQLARYHSKLGYPPEVTAETVLEIGCYEDAHIKGDDVPGIYAGSFAWLANYLVMPFVRLGRLEYQLHEYDGGVTAFKRASDGAVLALSDDGIRVAYDGLRLNGKASADAGWTTVLKSEGESVTGNPVDPRGRILRREVTLPLPAWEKILAEGDTVLDIHIPYGGGMGWDLVFESLNRATAFFSQHHSDRPIRGIVVTTWFMDPRLDGLLPPESNPVRFQRACHLYPCYPSPGSFGFIFPGAGTAAPDRLPRETSVQRAIVGFLEKGGVWHGGSMFILPSDVPNLRENFYRDGFDMVAKELFAK